MSGPFATAAIAETEALCVEWLDVYLPIHVRREHGHYIAMRAGYEAEADDPLGWDRNSVFVAIHSLLEKEEMRADEDEAQIAADAAAAERRERP